MEKELLNVCFQCQVEKPISHFHKQNQKNRPSRYLQAYCKDCQWLINCSYKLKTSRKFIFELFKKAENKCAICKKESKLQLDHCHKTGKIREFLCKHCNITIGMCNDNIAVLQEAIKYLQRHQE